MTPDPRVNITNVSIDTCVEAYESAYAATGTADVDRCLPDRTHPDYRKIAIEVLRVDLEYCWNNGRTDRLDSHLKAFPDVLGHADAMAQLTFEDYRLRLQAGDSVSPQFYATRYGADVTGWPDPSPASTSVSLSALRSANGCDDTPPKSERHTPCQPEAHRDTETKFQTATSPGQLVDVAVGHQFLNFDILAELGAGIGGRVFLARQPALAERKVVLKITHRSTIEAQRLARLQHSNVVPVYSVHEGETLSAICMPYLGSTMLSHWVEHLRGQPALPSTAADFLATFTEIRNLEQVRDKTPAASTVPAVPDGKVAASFRLLRHDAETYCSMVLHVAKQLSEGLAHAHQSGILHRDLKPANILLTDDGQPMLLDFHLALQLNNATTLHESAGGTLPYMCPEQLRSLVDDGSVAVDERGDIYSLGVILFELLTGRLPFATSTGKLSEVATRAIAVRTTVPSLRQHNAEVSPATEAIVRKCLHPDPQKRYNNAHELADDLQRQIESRPLLRAGNPSVRERVKKWYRRHPGATSGTSVSVVCGLLLLLGLVAWNVRERRLAALQAFQTFTEVQQKLPEAMAALSVPLGDPGERASAMESAKELISVYDLVGNTPWTDRPDFRLLQPTHQALLKDRFGELLFLMASAEAQHRPSSATERLNSAISHAATTGSDVASVDSDALRYNRQAFTCYVGTDTPKALLDQQRELYRLHGLDSQMLPTTNPEAGDSTTDRITEGTHLLVQNRLHSALKTFEELSRQLPDDFLVWFRLGTCHYRLGEFMSAHDCFTTCLAISPHSHQARYWRGMTELKSSQFTTARGDFQHLLDKKPDYARALVCRGLAWMGEQQWQNAIDDFTAAIEHGFSQTRIYFLRSQCHKQLGNEELANADQELGLQKTPSDSLSWVSRGIARLATAPDEAIADFRQAIRINPAEHEAYRNIAHVLSEKLNRPEDAIAVLDETLTDTNEDALCWMGRAVLNARLKNTAAAHADAARALEFSQAPLVLYQAACVHALAPLDKASTETAMQLLARALEIDDSLIKLALSDTDLKSLQSNERFRKLIAAARIIQMMSDKMSSAKNIKK